MTDVLEQQWSRNDTLDNSEDTIASWFERQVAAVPDKLAIVTDEISLTYRALDREASRIAAALVSLPSQHDRPIVLFMQDDAARTAAMLGVLKASRIFIPLAPNSPEKWLTQVIEDSGTAHIIANSSTRSIAELAAPGNVTVMEVEQLPRSLEPFVADQTASSDDIAYIVYTSGSTGRPKGVAINHSRSMRSIDVRYPLFGLGRSDRYANLRSSGVTSGITNTFMPLLSGGSLFPFDLNRHGLQQLAPWLVEQKITYVSLSGSLLRTWLKSLPGDLRLPSLRFVGATGERLYAEDVIRVSRHLEGEWRIGHSYGSTEAGMIAAQVFTASQLPDTGIVAVGRPVDGVEVSITDDTGALVAPGEVGEIVVRSRFLAPGYWNNPDLTAKVFRTDPLDNTIRTYSTGDLGRWRSDGTLEHMGRKGRRIRLRGYNIEPFQIECELMRQPGITDAVALLHDGAVGQEPCLVGYVVAPANASPSIIRNALAERLPSYMVPSHIVVLDSFPIASSGKVDRNALPPPDWRAARSVAFRAPSDDREQALLAIWQEILKLPKIGVDDDFFELGGTSLQALLMFARIESQLSCSLSPTRLVQAPTVARLAELIRDTAGVAESQSLVPLRSSGKGLPLFLVSGRILLAIYYRHLVSDLKSDRPIFGLQPPALDGTHRIARTVESMASDYVTEIRRVQPHGPYSLAGHSLAGRVSFEIAQQLLRAGERVSFLGLIDTGPAGGWPLLSEVARISRKARRMSSFRELLFRGLVFIGWRLKFIREELVFRRYDRWIQQGRAIPHEYRALFHDRLCVRASRNYVGKPYPGHITLFSSAGNSERQRAHWTPHARGGLTVFEMPAEHAVMLFAHNTKLLAGHFDTCLDATVREECASAS